MSLAKYIKKHRLNKSLSIESVSSLTNIPRYIIENLENENFEILPRNVYVEGHLKSLSRVLNFDSNEAILLYRESVFSNKSAPSSPIIYKYKTINPTNKKKYIFGINHRRNFIDYLNTNLFLKFFFAIFSFVMFFSFMKAISN